MYCRLRSVATVAHHFKINESSVRFSVKEEKDIFDAITAAIQAGTKPCTLSHIENAAFM